MKDILEFIETRKSKVKRTVFDLDFLEEWLRYLDSHGFLHTHRVDGKVKGVCSVFPIGKHKKTPSLEFVIECMQLYQGGETDYFIMDILVDSPESRKVLVKRLLKVYPDAESNSNCQIFAQRGDKIVKFNKHILLTFIK